MIVFLFIASLFLTCAFIAIVGQSKHDVLMLLVGIMLFCILAPVIILVCCACINIIGKITKNNNINDDQIYDL